MMDEDDYSDEEEIIVADPEQKLSIATYFIMSSPVGEVDFVTADTKKLVDGDWKQSDDGDRILSKDSLSKILKEYNIEKMTIADTPDGKNGETCMTTSYGQIEDNVFGDPNTGNCLEFDHITRQFTKVIDDRKMDSIDDSIDAVRAAVQKQANTYLTKKFKSGQKQCKAACVVYANQNGDIFVCITAQNTKISAYWTGGWNSVFSFNCINSTSLTGNVKIHVHYFEDGNVQFHTAIKQEGKLELSQDPKETAKRVVGLISDIEDKYHQSLQQMYIDIHHESFKEMRRFLPITKQPMNWNILAHGVKGLTK